RRASLVEDILAGTGSHEPVARPPTDVVLEAIVAHPVIRDLERAWRGLHFLAARAAPGADRSAPRVVVEAVHAAADEVEAVLDRVARLARDRGPDRAFDLLVVDHALDASARDLARLEAWAARAEGVGAPLVAGGTPALV